MTSDQVRRAEQCRLRLRAATRERPGVTDADLRVRNLLFLIEDRLTGHRIADASVRRIDRRPDPELDSYLAMAEAILEPSRV
jgi:hypothetical protein